MVGFLLYWVICGAAGFVVLAPYSETPSCMPYNSVWGIITISCSHEFINWLWYVVLGFPRFLIIPPALGFTVPKISPWIIVISLLLLLIVLPGLYYWWKNPKVTRYLPLAGKGHIPLEDIQAFIRRVNEPDSPELGVLFEDKKGHPIGCGGFRNFKDNAAEVSLVIGETSLHGQGIGSEAMMLLLQYGFQELNLQKIWLIVREDNAKGISLFKKFGFEMEEVLINAVTIDGQPKNKWRMALLREEWKNPKD